MPGGASRGPEDLTLWQRAAYRRMLKLAGKRRDDPLTPEDWEAYFALGRQRSARLVTHVLRSLPHDPRCRLCGAPFAGVGGRLVRPLGYRPSRKNPQLCVECVELAPPGGMTTELGVLFADVRNFTALTETIDPREASELLRRFYACAEAVLFPQALIDKLIGDEVMALYIPLLSRAGQAPERQMLEHARRLLEAVGDRTDGPPSLEVGIGLDFGPAFVGNIGDRDLYDFTAIGDVVNTASRLQEHAGPGEIVLSERLARRLCEAPPGERVELALKGKAAPFAAYRVRRA